MSNNHDEDLWIYDDDESGLMAGAGSGFSSEALEFDMDAIMAGLGDVQSDDGGSSLADRSAYHHYGEEDDHDAIVASKSRKHHHGSSSDTESCYTASGTEDDGTIDVDDAMLSSEQKSTKLRENNCDVASSPSATVDAPLQGVAKLFQRMESQTRWKEVSTMLHLNPSYSMDSHYGTEVGEEGTYFKRLPLHHACRWNAPSPVIRELLILNPSAISARDAYSGVLPIHLACRYGSTDALRELLSRPSIDDIVHIAQQTDDMGRLPLHWACRNSSGSTPSYHQATTTAKVLPSKLLLRLVKAYPAAVFQRDRARCKTPMHYAREHPGLCHNKDLLIQMIKISSDVSREQQRMLLMENDYDEQQRAAEHDDAFSMSPKDSEDVFDVIPKEIYDDEVISTKDEEDEFDVIPAKSYVGDEVLPKNDTGEFDVIPAKLYAQDMSTTGRRSSTGNIKATRATAAAANTTRSGSVRARPTINARQGSASILPSNVVVAKKSASVARKSFGSVRSSSPPAPVINTSSPPSSPPPPPPPPSTLPPTTTKSDRDSSDDSHTTTSSDSAPTPKSGNHRRRPQPGSPRSVMDIMADAKNDGPAKQGEVTTTGKSVIETPPSSLAYPPRMSNSSASSSTASDNDTVSEGDNEVVVAVVSAKYVPKDTVANSKPNRKIYSKRQGIVSSTVRQPTSGVVVEKVGSGDKTKQQAAAAPKRRIYRRKVPTTQVRPMNSMSEDMADGIEA